MLIIVESPTKAKKIQAILGVKTLSTVGHFKDLPQTALGVDLRTYEPVFVLHERKANLPDQLRAAARNEVVMLAGDPDREGYAISRHIYEEIRSVARECRRMEIFEVTEKGLKEALARAAPFDQTNEGLYHAFLGRRVGDRLVGYILSPIASRRLRNTFSVGRVQSPAVRLVVDRECAIRAFTAAPYWILNIRLNKAGAAFTATHVKGKFEKREEAQALVEALQGESHALAGKVERKETRQFPRPPFTTVDLQAAAAARLKFTPEQTMKLAQALFDHGLTTYHRTDSVRMEDAFVERIRTHVGEAFGPDYVPAQPHAFKSRHSQAEAHEGIRPTHLHPAADSAAVVGKEQLTSDHARLYDLIYRRALASQMAPARYDATQLLFEVAGERFKANGRVLKFDGFLKLYADADPEEEKDRKGEKREEEPLQTLPPVVQGERVPKEGETLEEKKTKPPGRFTLGSLVKELERLGIGRPSTYAAITKNILDRGYVKEEKGKVAPLPPGEALIAYLKESHPWVIDYALTGKMEAVLDQVVERQETWQRFCKAVHHKMGYAAPPVRDPNGGPSEAQLKYAASLAARTQATIPSEVLKSAKALSSWIAAARAARGPTDS
jgi:DNA topoisomerase-1